MLSFCGGRRPGVGTASGVDTYRLHCGLLIHFRKTFSVTTPSRLNRRTRRTQKQIPSRDARRAAFAHWGSSRFSTRSHVGGKRPRAAIPGIYKKECAGSDGRPFSSAMELQADAGPLVCGAGHGTYRCGGGLYPRQLGEGKGHGLAIGAARARCEEDRRCGRGYGSRPHPQGPGTGTTST